MKYTLSKLIIILTTIIGLLSITNSVYSKGVLTNFTKDTEQEESSINIATAPAQDETIVLDQEKKIFLDSLGAVYDYVKQHYYKEIDTNQIFEGALQGLMNNLGDPYSTFITQKKAKEYQENIQGEFGGLGIFIDEGLDEESGIHFIKVIAPIEDTPAFYIGIQGGDLITAVDDTSTAEMTAQDAVKIMRGTPGSSVTLTIKRKKRIFKVNIVRAIIKVVDLRSDYIMDGVAYIRVLHFTDNIPPAFKKALKTFDSKKYDTLIVDLRNNPGGSLKAVLEVADFFLEEDKIIVGTETRNIEENEVFKSSDDPLIPNDKKVIVLINEGSASASEIFAGAIKDNARGTLVGSTTFGKGLVQSVNPYNGGFITMTISQYYTPSRTFINEIGIEPHIEITDNSAELTPEEIVHSGKILEEDLAQRFVEDKRGKIDEASVEEFRTMLAKQGVIINNTTFLKQALYAARNRYNNLILPFSLETDPVLSQLVEKIKKGEL